MSLQTLPSHEIPVIFRNVASPELLLEYANANKAEASHLENKKRHCRHLAPYVARMTGIDLNLIPSALVHQFSDQHDYLISAALFCAIAHVYARLDHFLQKQDPTDSPRDMFEPLIKMAGDYMEIFAALGCKQSRAEIDIWKMDLKDNTIVKDWAAAARRTQTLLYNCFSDKYIGQVKGNGAILMRGDSEKLLIDRWLQKVWDKCEFGIGADINGIDPATRKSLRPNKGSLEGKPAITSDFIERLLNNTTPAVMITEMTSLLRQQMAFRDNKEHPLSRHIDPSQHDIELGWHHRLIAHVIGVGCRIFGLEGQRATIAEFLQISVQFRTQRASGEDLQQFLIRMGLRTRTQ